jgi:hypothetical protein
MHSRPLLDYLAYPEEFPEEAPAAAAPVQHHVDPLDARLKDLEARLRANDPAPARPKQDLTLSAQIEAILRRKTALQPAADRRATPPTDHTEQAPRPARVVMDPPPTVPVANDTSIFDQEFLKFSEAVYLIGQAAKRFVEQPQAQPVPQQHIGVHAAPSTVEIDALSAVLRETVSAFRSVADDLAVSAGEIRHYATREERAPQRRRPQPARAMSAVIS